MTSIDGEPVGRLDDGTIVVNVVKVDDARVCVDLGATRGCGSGESVDVLDRMESGLHREADSIARVNTRDGSQVQELDVVTAGTLRCAKLLDHCGRALAAARAVVAKLWHRVHLLQQPSIQSMHVTLNVLVLAHALDKVDRLLVALRGQTGALDTVDVLDARVPIIQP